MYPRIVVTVDMIATGTDVKPLECLLFMRSVKSRTYFEQMTAAASGSSMTPTSRPSPMTPSQGPVRRRGRRGRHRYPLAENIQPLERKPGQSLENLFKQVAFGNTDPEVASTIAGRLARLDQRITREDRADLRTWPGEPTLATIVRTLLDSSIQMSSSRPHRQQPDPMTRSGPRRGRQQDDR